ncbi:MULTISPECIES: SGNH/GDSL hydrolase family protein [Oleiagrimonas]|jgi:lysophospholipase L1-like esterase|uniref:SGNH/GDSL hydrolase family protein n=1 Tax=Oleiagrimonas citrea TaxID=1665687 RepID=A0A846ZN95_9GAMM|nr:MULTISPECIES: SGNH/GDSL hydrolase family protein [Oleiagrimonas]NKZ39292.1 SGNH/GDSL hydrolase family protein [Oleiagrimonas citrea]RAP59726.1 lysophospholipase [Oleiagrimonas sp. MCCC 1A03011]
MIDASEACRYLALGDSYTIGEGVCAHDRWPQQVVNALRREGLRMDDPQIIAVTGWTTDELAAGMRAVSLQPPYDLVSLGIGVNNQYRGRDVGNYREEFAELLARAVHLAGDRPRQVMVTSIPDWGVTRFAREQGRDAAAIAREIDIYNAVGRDETLRAGAHWADVTALSRACGDDAEMLTDDGLHPSAAQYTLWNQRLLPLARTLLRQRRG